MKIMPEIYSVLNEEILRDGLQVARRDPQEALHILRGFSGEASLPAELQSIRTEDIIVNDNPHVPIRVYRPGRYDQDAIIVNLHGGGWVAGSVEGDDIRCRLLSYRLGCVVMSVEYRLAPEHPFPAGLMDCVAAVRWAIQNALSIGGNPENVCVFGTSAGGNLAAAAALWLADHGELTPRSLVLAYPMCAQHPNTASLNELSSGYFLTTEDIGWYWKQYSPDDISENRYASILNAPDFRQFPDALIITAELDPLRDEAEDFAEKLRTAGKVVCCSRYAGAIHGFFNFVPLSSPSSRMIEEMKKFIEDLNKKLPAK